MSRATDFGSENALVRLESLGDLLSGGLLSRGLVSRATDFGSENALIRLEKV